MSYYLRYLQLSCRLMYVDCGQGFCTSFRNFRQTHMDTIYLFVQNTFDLVKLWHVSMVLVVESCDTLFWKVFGSVYPISFWKTTTALSSPSVSLWLTLPAKEDSVQWKTTCVIIWVKHRELLSQMTLSVSMYFYKGFVCQPSADTLIPTRQGSTCCLFAIESFLKQHESTNLVLEKI